jgi:hypothetical protein
VVLCVLQIVLYIKLLVSRLSCWWRAVTVFTCAVVLVACCYGVHTCCVGGVVLRCSHVLSCWWRAVTVFTCAVLVACCYGVHMCCRVGGACCYGVHMCCVGGVLLRCSHVLCNFNRASIFIYFNLCF